MDLKELGAAVQQIANEKGISADKVFFAIESALAAAYKKEYRKRSEVIKAKFDPKTGRLKFWQEKTVVTPEEVRIVIEEEQEESKEKEVQGKEREAAPSREPREPENEEGLLPRYNPDRHIFLDEAKKIKKGAVSGDALEFPLETHSDFGRIAAQTAKQVVLQNLREAERSSIQEEFSGKEGQIVSGIVQRFERGNVYIDLGRAIGVMFRNESIPGEHYRPGERLRFYILAVQDDPRRPGIVLSRAHPKFIAELFKLEVPEIADGTVEIKSIAREAGSRTKIAVASKEERVDPIGSAVGQRGTRVIAITNELGNEKIDVVEWSEDPEKFIAHALSPAKVQRVTALPRREAKVFVLDDQLSLAIGKGGQNVRLAAKLTGWKIDVRSESRPDEVLEGGVSMNPVDDEADPAQYTPEEKEVPKEEDD